DQMAGPGPSERMRGRARPNGSPSAQAPCVAGSAGLSFIVRSLSRSPAGLSVHLQNGQPVRLPIARLPVDRLALRQADKRRADRRQHGDLALRDILLAGVNQCDALGPLLGM